MKLRCIICTLFIVILLVAIAVMRTVTLPRRLDASQTVFEDDIHTLSVPTAVTILARLNHVTDVVKAYLRIEEVDHSEHRLNPQRVRGNGLLDRVHVDVSWDQVEQIETISDALGWDLGGVFLPVAGGIDLEEVADYYNKEVEMGRLSERFKVVSEKLLPGEVLAGLKHLLEEMQVRRAPVRSRRVDPLLQLHGPRENETVQNWMKFHRAITRYELYEEDGLVEQLLHDIQTLKITDAYNIDDGTEIKLVLALEDGNKVLFKPLRFPRDVEAWPDQYYFFDLERHVAEIAAFHLDRLLGFRRVPPVAGRFINVTSEILQVSKDKDVTETFFKSINGKHCFYSKCAFFCDQRHSVCGQPHILEASLMTWLPTKDQALLQEWYNPWRRSYSKTLKTSWETDERYCDEVRAVPVYNSGRRLLDLIDLAIFDFLNGNLDRHDYYTYDYRYGSDTFIVNYDNGRGYGRSKHDDISILAPLRQCCLVRLSTVEKLLELETGNRPLSDLLVVSLSRDLLDPVLPRVQLKALDRRLRVVLYEIHLCAMNKKTNYTQVIVDDGF